MPHTIKNCCQHFGHNLSAPDNRVYFIPSGEFNAYLKQIKFTLSAVKKYRIFSLVMNTIYIFSSPEPKAPGELIV